MQRVVHLGLGNFHRAHQAWYTARAGDWQITGVIMSNRELRDHLAAHNNNYLLGIWGNDGLRTETVSVYDDVLLATEQSSKIVQRIADRDTHIVTLTVTEKGYHLRPRDNHLNTESAQIKNDLTADKPRTAIGLLASGLIVRAVNEIGPLSILSCDNLSDNGKKLRQVVIDYLAVKKPEVIPWVERNVAFPNTMVDRITPKLSEAAIDEIRSRSNEIGLPCVGTEAFSEWVIEDEFLTSRPDWGSIGVAFVSNIGSFEERKLRLLNASHTYLAYAGLLSGYQYVHQAVADPRLNADVNALWDEAQVTVSKPAVETIDAYRSDLINRFKVVEMRHELKQIAMDGSVKMRERVVPIIQSRANAGLCSPQACRVVATWIAFIIKAVECGTVLNDPQADQLMKTVQDSRDVSHCCENILQLIGMQRDSLQQVYTEVNSLIAN